MAEKKAIFLTNKSSLYSKVTGGVQLCSQEFLEILENVETISIENYYVKFTKNFWQRVQMKLGLENYSMYNVKADKRALIEYIEYNKIEVVFINMASLVRYAKPLKEYFANKVKIILMSHGNHSGDFIQFFDADDLMDADKIEQQIEQLLNHPNCVSTCKWLRFRNNINEPIGGIGPYHSIQKDLSVTDWLLQNQMMVLHAWLSPRNLIMQSGGWDESLTVNQDGEFFYRVVALSNKIIFQPNTTVYYRNPAGNSNVSKINMYHKYESLFKAALSYKKIVNQITQNSIEGKRAIGDYFRQLVYNYFYPNYKELLLKCTEQDEYHISTLEPELTGITQKIGKLFGWKIALSLKHKLSKYLK